MSFRVQGSGFRVQCAENSAFPVLSFRVKPIHLSCTPDITTGVLGGRINTSRCSSSNIQRFPACKGDPSAALGMTVRGSSLSVSLGTFDPSASRILIKEVRVCAHHLIEERQYSLSLIPNPCFQISGFGDNGYNEPLSRSMSHHQCRRILSNAV